MKKLLPILLCLILLLNLPACTPAHPAEKTGNTSSQPESPPPPSSGEQSSSQKLVIKSFTPTARTSEIELLAEEFMALHEGTDIQVEFEKPYPYGISLTRGEVQAEKEGYYTRLRAELASGEADYLLCGASNGLDFYSLAPNGVLQDMAERLENDPDIEKDSLFMPVLEAFKVGGKLPILPYAFTLQGVYLRRDILNECEADPAALSTVNAEDVLGWYEKAQPSHPDMKLFFATPQRDGLFRTELPRYIDLEAGAASFDSPAFLSFLDRTRNALWEEPQLQTEEEWNIGNGQMFEAAMRYRETGEIPDSVVMYDSQMNIPAPKNVVTKAQPAFCALAQGSVYDFLTIAQPQAFQYLTGALPLASTDGRLGINVVSGTDFAMPASLQNSGLAWEFIKFCLSTRKSVGFSQSGTGAPLYYCGNGLPVNRENLALLLEAAADSIQKESSPSAEMFNFQPVDQEEAIVAIEGILEQNPVALCKYNLDLQDYLDEYYVHNLTTPEQCAKKLQDRAYIWLNE